MNTKSSTAKDLLETWKKVQKHLELAWNVWKEEYLPSLRERYQRYMKSPLVTANIFPAVDQVVHIKEAKLPRGSWKMG